MARRARERPSTTRAAGRLSGRGVARRRGTLRASDRWLAATIAAMAIAIAHDQTAAAARDPARADRPGGAAARRVGVAWPLAAGAPALGAIGLAGRLACAAARARTPWQTCGPRRTGWLWLADRGRAVHRDRPSTCSRCPNTPPPSIWITSPYETLHHVLAPLICRRPVGACAGRVGARRRDRAAAARQRPVAEARHRFGSSLWAALLVALTAAALRRGAAPQRCTIDGKRASGRGAACGGRAGADRDRARGAGPATADPRTVFRSISPPATGHVL